MKELIPLAARVNVANAEELGTVWRDPDQDRQGVKRARPSSYATFLFMSTPSTCPGDREQGVPQQDQHS